MQLNSKLLREATSPLVSPSQDEKNMAMLAWILGLFFPFLGPLIVYLIKKDESPFVAAHAKAILNFNITTILIGIIGAFLMLILIGFLVLFILGILHTVVIILGLISANDGKLYKTPFTLQLI